ncbi:hypothetical protein ACVIGA_009022 [Bradyrhizobium sp. USDA 3240]
MGLDSKKDVHLGGSPVGPVSRLERGAGAGTGWGGRCTTSGADGRLIGRRSIGARGAGVTIGGVGMRGGT